MGEKSVKISIAGRSYPLKVDSMEEVFVNEAAELINKRVSQLETGFVVKDKQDLLALTALQFATQYLESQTKVIDDDKEGGLLARLTEVDDLLDVYLAKSR